MSVTLAVSLLVAAGIAFALYRLVAGAAPWLGAWSYELGEKALVVRVKMPGGLALRTRRIPYRTIVRVVRAPAPGIDARVVPYRFGRKRLLGSNATPDTVDLERRGLRSLVVVTPPEPDAFAHDLRVALANARSGARPAARPWYTRGS